MSRATKSTCGKDPRVLFGQRVAYLRKQIGWSQEKLALESGLARSYLGGVERGQRNIALGPTEFRLLRHLIENPGRVYSRERLLDAVTLIQHLAQERVGRGLARCRGRHHRSA